MSITNCQSSKQSIERNTNLKQSDTDPLKSKGRIKCLGGVSNPCRPIAYTVLSFSYRESCNRGILQNLENAIIGENETKLLNCADYQILGAIL